MNLLIDVGGGELITFAEHWCRFEDDPSGCENKSSCSLSHKDREHDEKMIRSPWSGRLLRVDAGIATLLQKLWKGNIRTLMSCENNINGFVWINFFDQCSANQFMNLIVERNMDDKSFIARVLGKSNERRHMNWRHRYYNIPLAIPRATVGLGWWRSKRNAATKKPNGSISVRFPHDDLQKVILTF